MKARHNVRAVLLDGGQLVFLRRGWPGVASYYTTVGGGVEAEDADFEAALRREVMEEIGATIGPATEFLTLTEPGEKATVVQHYFRADVLDMDLNRRSGPELDDPDIGDFSPVRAGVPRGPWRASRTGTPGARCRLAGRCCHGSERTAACFRQATRSPRAGSLRVRWRGHLREGARHRQRQR
jgi:8-oxo-dGTP pyrophosphatase MutT (NUDIX family)